MKIKQYDELVKEGRELFDKEKYSEAIKCFEEAFKEYAKADDLITLGYCYFNDGNINKAKEIFEMINTDYPNADAYYGLSAFYEKIGKKADALFMLEEALKLRSDDPKLYFVTAYLYTENKEYLKAEEYLLKCIALDDKYFWAYVNLGNVYEQLNRDKEALQMFIKGRELSPETPMISYDIGVACAKLNMFDEAIQAYKDEIKKDNCYEGAYYNIALLYKDYLKDYETARYYYLKGIEKKPDDYNVWYNLGCLYAVMKDYDNTFDCFKYIYYKNRKYLDYMEIDKELDEFKKSKQYQELLSIMK